MSISLAVGGGPSPNVTVTVLVEGSLVRDGDIIATQGKKEEPSGVEYEDSWNTAVTSSAV